MIILAIVALSTILVVLFAITYRDYKRHRKPLAQMDSGAGRQYTYIHHMKVVSFPMLRYRFSISVQKKSNLITKF